MENQKQKQRPENRKCHIIYKTICSVTNKFYIGMHSTDNLEDGYLGSGQILSKSIKKYGKEKHLCEVLEFHSDRVSLANREEEILTKEFRENPFCMNIRGGGTGNYLRPAKEETRAKMSIAHKGRVITPEWRDKISKSNKGKKISQEQIENQRAKMLGRKWTPEQIEARKQGQQNSEKFKAIRRAVVIDGVEYEQVFKAGEALNISPSTLSKRCDSEYFFEYQYKDSPKVFKEKVPHGSRAVVVNGIEYTNKAEASRALGMTPKMVHSRCISDKYVDCYYKEN